MSDQDASTIGRSSENFWIWTAATDLLGIGDVQSVRSQLLERYTNSRMPGVYPSILWDDEDAQKLSIPTPDHPGRHVYARRPGAAWTEES